MWSMEILVVDGLSIRRTLHRKNWSLDKFSKEKEHQVKANL